MFLFICWCWSLKMLILMECNALFQYVHAKESAKGQAPVRGGYALLNSKWMLLINLVYENPN